MTKPTTPQTDQKKKKPVKQPQSSGVSFTLGDRARIKPTGKS